MAAAMEGDMRFVLLLLVLWPFGLGAATYKCRDARGQWTTQACFAAPPKDLSVSRYQRWLRERQPDLVSRAQARTKLGPYCFHLDRLASFYDCVEGQLKVYDEIQRILAALPPDSLPRRHLQDCLARNIDAASGATDYRQARACYDRP
jgi:hypothetical protein